MPRRLQHTSTLQVQGLTCQVTRKNIKRMYLRLDKATGQPRITAPLLTSDAAICNFVSSRMSWIKQQQEALTFKQQATPREFISGETLRLWGISYQLQLISEPKRKQHKLVLSAPESGPKLASLYVPSNSTPQQRSTYVKEWYRQQLAAEIARLAPLWEERTGLKASQWRTKDMSSRWGSCNTKEARIWISLNLTRYPLPCLEYVILHELAHLKVSNHGPDFKAILDEYMPDWRERRKLLK